MSSQNKKQILQKLSQNIFISQTMRNKIIASWDGLSEFQKEKIIHLVQHYDDLQNALISRAAEKNPNLKTDMENILRKTNRKCRTKIETGEKQNENEYLKKQFQDELDKAFE